MNKKQKTKKRIPISHHEIVSSYVLHAQYVIFLRRTHGQSAAAVDLPYRCFGFEFYSSPAHQSAILQRTHKQIKVSSRFIQNLILLLLFFPFAMRTTQRNKNADEERRIGGDNTKNYSKYTPHHSDNGLEDNVRLYAFFPLFILALIKLF